MTLWQQFRDCLRMALDPACWFDRLDAWIIANHMPPYDWYLPHDIEPWVPCRMCRKDWPCEQFSRAEERQKQRADQ